MTATDSYVGGIAGVNIGTIEKCVAGGNLSVTQANGNSYQVYLGGIAGRIEQFGNMGGYGNIYSGRTAADSTGHLILSDNPAKSRMAHGTGRAHMSCYRSGYPAILDLTSIILCHNTREHTIV